MAKKTIKSSDVLGNNYYIYELSSSNYTPALNGTITITCTVTDVYEDPIGSKSITLYKNGTSVSTKTTNSSGVATWSVTCSTAGIQSFKVGNKAIEIFVDNKSDTDHTHSNYVTTSDSRLSDARTPTSHTHGSITNDGKITSSTTMASNSQYVVYADANGAIKRADTMPAAYLRDPAAHSQIGNSAGDNQYTINGKINTALAGKADFDHTHSQYLTEHQSLANYVTTSDSRLSDARTPTSHAHGNLQNNGQVGSTAQANKNVVTNSSGLITTEDKPTIPSKTSQLTNDSGFLTSHQSLDSKTVTVEKLATATSGYLSSYVVKQNGVQVGNTINIPKDFLVKSGSVKTVSTANNPISGYKVGDKYIDLIINVQEGTSTDSHIYILVSDLVDTPIDIQDVTDLSGILDNIYDTKADTNHSHDIVNLNPMTQDGAGIVEAGMDKDGQGIGYGDSKLIYNQEDNMFYYDKNGTADYDAGNELATMNDIPNISGKENTSNKVTSLSSSSTDTQYPSAKVVYDSLNVKEDKSNKVNSWSNTTNNTRYPTEKLVKDSLDGKANTNHTHDALLHSNDDSDILIFASTVQGYPNGEGTPLGAFLSEFWRTIYPVGSIYMSVNATSPETLFGGSWERLKDRFLLGSGDTYANGATGGSADATLVSHQHGTSESGEYFVTSEANGANNTKVSYNASGNRYVDGMTSDSTPFHHRTGTGYVGSSGTGKNMPPYLAVYMWKRVA